MSCVYLIVSVKPKLSQYVTASGNHGSSPSIHDPLGCSFASKSCVSPRTFHLPELWLTVFPGPEWGQRLDSGNLSYRSCLIWDGNEDMVPASPPSPSAASSFQGQSAPMEVIVEFSKCLSKLMRQTYTWTQINSDREGKVLQNQVNLFKCHILSEANPHVVPHFHPNYKSIFCVLEI